MGEDRMQGCWLVGRMGLCALGRLKLAVAYPMGRSTAVTVPESTAAIEVGREATSREFDAGLMTVAELQNTEVARCGWTLLGVAWPGEVLNFPGVVGEVDAATGACVASSGEVAG